MTNNDLINIGFKEIHHFTIGNTVTYDLGRCRQLSASSVGTPNEMLFICEVDERDSNKIDDLVCLHNRDYDGKLKIEKVSSLINLLKNDK